MPQLPRMRSWLAAARFAFIVLAALFIWKELRGHGDTFAAQVFQVTWWRLTLALTLVLAALLVTGFLWRAIAATLGYELTASDSFGIFFVGQLGKYIPGSVWSFGAQALSGRRHGIPARTTVAVSLAFLVIHVTTGLALSSVLGLMMPGMGISSWLWWSAFGVSLICLYPPLFQIVLRRAAGISLSELDLKRMAQFLSYMALSWGLYAGSLFALEPHSNLETVARLTVAYALGYVAGVLVIVAPAGLGARETVFVMVLAPTLGVGEAAALALLTRVLAMVGDVSLAVFAAIGLRSLERHRTNGSSRDPRQSRPKENADSRSCCE